jgi:hypothetical protein
MEGQEMHGRQRLTAKLLSGCVRCVQLDEMSLVCQIYVGPLPRDTYLLRRELTGRRPHLYEYFLRSKSYIYTFGNTAGV